MCFAVTKCFYVGPSPFGGGFWGIGVGDRWESSWGLPLGPRGGGREEGRGEERERERESFVGGRWKCGGKERTGGEQEEGERES
jgi:hypothetical protein